MAFTLLAKILGIALLSLTVSATQAHKSDHPLVRNDIICPKGSYTSFVRNNYAYNAPLDKFTDITKSFFNLTWYVSRCDHHENDRHRQRPWRDSLGRFGRRIHRNTDGVPQTPGCARVQLPWEPYTYAPPNQKPLHFPGYAETIRFESICGGTATYFDAIAYVCSDDQMAAYDTWYTLHMVAFPGLATEVGAKVLAGDCPLTEE
ncbi:hypothetical protein FB451DRAFT_441584 [Mycena latifolia]|nr:hypothetical protein FB451DRAFT_441584 [Mycena latifolia]